MEDDASKRRLHNFKLFECFIDQGVMKGKIVFTSKKKDFRKKKRIFFNYKNLDSNTIALKGFSLFLFLRYFLEYLKKKLNKEINYF